VILGPGGAGKSFFAARLAQITGLPLVELDGLFWNGDLAPSRRASPTSAVTPAGPGSRFTRSTWRGIGSTTWTTYPLWASHEAWIPVPPPTSRTYAGGGGRCRRSTSWVLS